MREIQLGQTYSFRRTLADGDVALCFGDLKQDQILRSMRLFAEEVMLAFREGADVPAFPSPGGCALRADVDRV